MAIRPLSRDTGARIPTPVCSLARNDKLNHDSVYPRLVQDSFVGGDVGALRKHAGGMFLASDLGGYAAVVSILVCTAPS